METYAFFDVDRTIRIGSAALDFCNYLAIRGVVPAAFNQGDSQAREQYRQGNIDYREMVERVVKIHGAALSGLSVKLVETYFKGFTEEVNGFFDWVPSVFRLLQEKGVKTVLVSAGIYPAIDAIAQQLKVDKIFTSALETVGEVYTGRVLKTLHDTDKRELVGRYIEEIDRPVRKIGFGDSTGDVEMLKLMDYVFIIDPHQEEMLDIAAKNEWTVIRDGTKLLPKISRLIEMGGRR